MFDPVTQKTSDISAFFQRLGEPVRGCNPPFHEYSVTFPFPSAPSEKGSYLARLLPFIFMACHLYGPQSVTLQLKVRGHRQRRIAHARGEAPFIVIPRKNADQLTFQDLGLLQRKSR